MGFTARTLYPRSAPSNAGLTSNSGLQNTVESQHSHPGLKTNKRHPPLPCYRLRTKSLNATKWSRPSIVVLLSSVDCAKGLATPAPLLWRVTHCIGEIVLGGNLETDTLGHVNRLISQMNRLSRVTAEPCRITAIHSRRNGFVNLSGPRRARDIVLYLRIRSLGLKSDSM